MLGKDNLFYNYGQTFGPVKKREGELPHGTSPPANLKQPTKEIDNFGQLSNKKQFSVFR